MAAVLLWPSCWNGSSAGRSMLLLRSWSRRRKISRASDHVFPSGLTTIRWACVAWVLVISRSWWFSQPIHQTLMYLGRIGKVLSRLEGSADEAIEVPDQLGSRQAGLVGFARRPCATALGPRRFWITFNILKLNLWNTLYYIMIPYITSTTLYFFVIRYNYLNTLTVPLGAMANIWEI